jgi:hypothetical protein
MKRNLIPTLLACSLLALSPLAIAQQPMAGGLSAAPAPDPTFTAYSLAHACARKNDDIAQSQCIGAVRGIVHGYQYGVLFLGQQASLPAAQIQRVSLCLNGVPVNSLVDEFVGDASQVADDSLKKTPAEVAVLGSLHMHHACS